MITPRSRRDGLSVSLLCARPSDQATHVRLAVEQVPPLAARVGGQQDPGAALSGACAARSRPRGRAARTMARLCASRVTSRITTGTRKRSERSNASRVMS